MDALFRLPNNDLSAALQKDKLFKEVEQQWNTVSSEEGNSRRKVDYEIYKSIVIPGMEPTGHYWFNLGAYLQDNGMKPVHVNPHHVKKSKELDDNNPNKNDRKDPKTIAALVNEGRFSYPYIPTGVYAEIRSLSNLRLQA